MPRGRKKKYNEHKRSKILTDDDEEEESKESETELNYYKTKKRNYDTLIDSNKGNGEGILTVSEFEYVNSVVKSTSHCYDIIKNEEFTYNGNPFAVTTNDKWKYFINMLMHFKGCNVNISKYEKKPEDDKEDTEVPTDQSPKKDKEEEEIQFDITIDSIISFKLISTESKDYVEYYPIDIKITLDDDDDIFYKELEIPKGDDIMKLINILLKYKNVKSSS